MHVDKSTITAASGKTYTRYLLRTSYREDGQVKHHTVANLSHCTPQEIKALRLALRHKHDLEQLGSLQKNLRVEQGRSCGAVWAAYQVARELGLVAALGPSPAGRLALWQVLARVLEQGSRLSAVRCAKSQAACEVLGITQPFTEDDLYTNLDWLAAHQPEIEDRLFRRLAADNPPTLYLYDVTSSYLEGTQNALAAFGYNRDGKRGKKQLVIGLLCNAQGVPLTLEVFRGNTQDPATVASQIEKVVQRFGGGPVTFVGDRGMLKQPQVDELQAHGLHYLTAITKPQIMTLLHQGVIQMGLFDAQVCEVQDGPVRYLLRRNPLRAAEMQAHRQDKLTAVQAQVQRHNTYLAEHPRAQVETALRQVTLRCQRLGLASWLTVTVSGRTLDLAVDAAQLAACAQLDGCDVLKTDLPATLADTHTVHARYKDLAQLEQGFRTCKTAHLELRPIYVRRASRTRGHAFVVMLAYRIVQVLAQRWQHLDVTVEEGLNLLKTVCAHTVFIKATSPIQLIPKPTPEINALLRAADVTLPKALPQQNVLVDTRRKLPSRRKNA